MTLQRRTIAALAACLWLSAVPAKAQWRQCATELDALRAAAEEAHEASSTVASLEASLLETRDAYTRCRQDLDVFRIDRETSPISPAVQLDGCNQQVQTYRTTERRYAAEMDQAGSLFRALAAAVQAVELSCQYPLAAYAPAEPPAESPSPACERFLGTRPGVPLESLRVLCTAEMSADECAACLGEPQD
ncbi:MAG: hypothetical protein OXG72_12860 [Acidobacteria bacterium]|nr:hypothetical protein [Acidobacteriota bacterium]